jgi:hypothetical protein
MVYIVEIDEDAFGQAGFGGAMIVDQHNSPPKSGDQSVVPEPCGDCIVNVAVATGTACNGTVSATASASTCTTPPPPPPDDNTSPGTGTPGYWKNHPEAWPVNSIKIGKTVFTKTEALDWLKRNDSQDKRVIMFRALLCAKLNLLIGNDGSCITETINLADAWWCKYGGSKQAGNSAAWKAGEPLASKLDAYNNGKLCAPHRDLCLIGRRTRTPGITSGRFIFF